MEQAAKTGDLEKIVEADLRFHDVVISSSGQPHTVQVWRTIFPRIRGVLLPLRPRPEPGDDGGGAPRAARGAPDPGPGRDDRAARAATSRCAAHRGREARSCPRRQGGARVVTEPLLRVENLRTGFATAGGLIRAVDGVDSRAGRGRHARRRRRVGQRQVGDRALDHAARRPARAAIEPGSQILFEGRDLTKLSEHEMSAIRGQRHLDDLPGADDVAESRLHRRRPDRRGRRAPPGARYAGRDGARSNRREDSRAVGLTCTAASNVGIHPMRRTVPSATLRS